MILVKDGYVVLLLVPYKGLPQVRRPWLGIALPNITNIAIAYKFTQNKLISIFQWCLAHAG